MVEAAVKPGQQWRAYPTRTLEDLAGSVQSRHDPAPTQYGGLLPSTGKATGFFHTAKIGDRWWLVDPDGGLFICRGVTSVAPLRAAGAQAALEKKFGSRTNWAIQTTQLLRANGFNSVGAWAEIETLRGAPDPLVYTRNWNFMSSYGRKRGGTYQKPGHTGYPNDCMFVFDPEFESFCDEHARQLAAGKNDPWLLGHFSDNELPLRPDALLKYLGLPERDAGHQAALHWLRARRGATAVTKDATEQDQRDFLAFVVERYFRIVSEAIRKYDPNHLFLGARFHGSDLRMPEVFRASGRFLDVVSVNYYNAWTPDPQRLEMWEREAGKPVLITEWYVKGMDAGLPNVSGAGWVVRTQADRGRFYENFTLALLESKHCVGWHWFKYADNDPADLQTDPSNRDSNKGIVSNRYEPYQALLGAMKRINERSHALVDFFDAAHARKNPQVKTQARDQ
jgi:hypothetical protein